MSKKNTVHSELTRIRPLHTLPKTIASEVLLGHLKQIFILHDGHSYQLRITKLGKLILTK
ncbi:hemin uptake protein HemP [Polynucleobacter sp. Ross1-W9]|uniref:hemin uptake protein HemP n=1 Tax=Polynucleobacter parvulilacunae TaxID=1855631 RepID=UPI001C0AD696|nr:hemin uptake protein HemP [Polynucleobacter parvulilacunae]MBU3556008.1 hemin uptake protein HemP [Polynucleobacter parvulilacunae]